MGYAKKIRGNFLYIFYHLYSLIVTQTENSKYPKFSMMIYLSYTFNNANTL